MIWFAPLVYYLMSGTSSVNDTGAYRFQLPATAIGLEQIGRETYFPFKRQTLKRIKRNNNLDTSLEKKIDEAVSKEAKDFAKSYQKVIRPVLRAKIKAEIAKDKAVEAKDKAVEAKNKLALKVNGLEKDLFQIGEYAKDRYCAMNLRSSIEGVRLRCVTFHTDDEKKQNTLGSQLGTIWKNREKTLCSVLVNLGSVMISVHSTNDNDTTCVEKAEQNFKTMVKRLHELDIFLPVETPGFYRNALIDEIEFLNKNENKDESSIFNEWKEKHKDFWLTKATVWRSETDLNDRGDILIVQRLVKNITVEKQTSMKLETLEQLAYVKAIVRANVEGLQMSSQAEQCLWIIIVHSKSFFTRIAKEMSENSEEWKKLDETGKYLQFCAGLGKFYNTLSVIDPHRDAPALPSSCPVGSKDYSRYVKQITLASPELRIVGRALIKLAVQDELFEETAVNRN